MDVYKNEATECYGITDAYKEFESKTAAYTESVFSEAAEALNGIFKKFAECKGSGCTPDSAEAQTLVRELQEFITRNFYTCTDEILKGLGAMYTADQRFKENINKNGSGTAEFVSKAIEFNCKGLN